MAEMYLGRAEPGCKDAKSLRGAWSLRVILLELRNYFVFGSSDKSRILDTGKIIAGRDA
jgi:hypothetical protein